MALSECGNGHVYDSDQYASCPYCNGGGNRIDFGAAADSDIGKTAPVGGGFGPAMQRPASGMKIGATVAPQSYRKKKEQEEDVGKTVGVLQKSMKLEPVVGWLVCIEGADKGKITGYELGITPLAEVKRWISALRAMRQFPGKIMQGLPMMRNIIISI